MRVVTIDHADNILVLFEHRGGDAGGPSLHLIVRIPAELSGKATWYFEQIWRGDCFRDGPHEHLFGPDGERITDLLPEETHDRVGWFLRRLEDLAGIARDAGYPDLGNHISFPSDTKYLEILRSWMLEPQSAS